MFQQRKILECLFANKADTWAPEFISALEARKVNPELVRDIRERAVSVQQEQRAAENILEEEKGK